ncbi:MAG TPA: dihydrodipicolinate synthase family protein [Ktedonobacteraceae bacterium]|nr:dihydrodipicolinate synthase family protein [Ktedonobacteraceae bacterium]
MLNTLPGGIYPPLPTFFDDQEELDLNTLRRHMERLANSGIAGYVLMGTNGEAVHLSGDERTQVIMTAREVVTKLGITMPIIAGCGAQSTRTTIAYCRQAARSGADVALVLPPFYYRGRMDNQALIAHYHAVADSSPLPVLLYNMPGSAAGLDLDAATICTLAQHPQIIGVKDSAGNIAKLSEVVAAVPSSFRVFAGNAGFLLPALAVGAVGTVSALANIYPRATCRLQTLFEEGQLEAARKLQARIIPPNAAVTTKYSVPGLKAALELVVGYGGKPRQPLLPLTEAEKGKLAEILQNARLEEI